MEFFHETYTIALPLILGYIIWLLQEQRKKQDQENQKRADNSKGTMLLLRVQLIEYHDKYTQKGEIQAMPIRIFVKCMRYITRLVAMA